MVSYGVQRKWKEYPMFPLVCYKKLCVSLGRLIRLDSHLAVKISVSVLIAVQCSN
jgi:hypothetical protein